MKPITVAGLLLTTSVFLGWSSLQREDVGRSSGPGTGGSPGDPTLSEVRQQCNEIATFFPVDPVDPALARRWVPQTYKLDVDAQGKASGAIIFMNCPKYFWVRTPNSPPLQAGKNTAPGSVVHLWFMLQGPAEVLPVPGAEVTAPTRYAYAVADFVTSPIVAGVYRLAGKNAVIITDTTLVEHGKRQTAKIIFTNGRKITLEAYTATQLPAPVRYGGNIWLLAASLFCSFHLRRIGRHRFAWYSLVSTIVGAVFLVLMAMDAQTRSHVGLFQRLSFGIMQLWLGAFALSIWPSRIDSTDLPAQHASRK